MAKPHYDLKTKGGCPLNEVVSALQKCIRRGLEEEAMYWALEMAEAGFGQYLWKRLMVIAAEDIELANPDALTLTTSGWLATKETTKSFSRPPGMKTEFLGPVILYLCRSPKSREGDDFTWYIMERRKRQWHLEIPDVALDYHTERGRKMGRGQTHWFEEASKLENAVGGNKYAELVKDLVEGK
jgi:replication-associated recombination protein RarA